MKNRYLGIELGSTRIKAVAIGENCEPVASGDYTWCSDFKDGIWTYEISQVWNGLRTALNGINCRDLVRAVGISGMMHGYLAFDENWNLLVPFRTWQNTITAEAADKLTALFDFNIPQRWSIAHLYQAMLNGEEHVSKIAHITTLAGYVHYMLTGVNAIGIGEASGMFPINSQTNDYDEGMLQKFEELAKDMPWRVREVLPKVLVAGENAGTLTESGANLIDNMLAVGTPFAPPEGDAGTGMVATNAVRVRTGNISAGTSIFSMVVLKKPLSKVYQEIDIVTTPAGDAVAMVHCNNCTNDMNKWVSVLNETLKLFGKEVTANELYTKLYQHSLEGDADCGDVLTYNYMAGEGITHLDCGRPMVIRNPESNFTLANFLRSQLYATMATLRLGMDILDGENVKIDTLTGHGGLFKTPIVGQRYMAAACNVTITCMEAAGEGGPYGMALLASFMANKNGDSLSDYLDKYAFSNSKSVTISPDENDLVGFNKYMQRYKNGLAVEVCATENL